MSECRLRNPRIIILPQDKGEPPLWYPAFAGLKGIYVPREQYENLKKHISSCPCEFCPEELKKECKENGRKTEE